MSAITVIEKVLDKLEAGPLSQSMVYVPGLGATHDELSAEDRLLPRKMSARHRDLLMRWNGINLDMIRVYGVGQTDARIKRLSQRQLDISQDFPGWVVFASNPAGFVYAEDPDGVVHSYDTQALSSTFDAEKIVASDIDDFFFRFVFGSDSDKFCAGDCKPRLLEAGVLLGVPYK